MKIVLAGFPPLFFLASFLFFPFACKGDKVYVEWSCDKPSERMLFILLFVLTTTMLAGSKRKDCKARSRARLEGDCLEL